MWTPLPSKALRYPGRVETSVLPSPVFISAMLPTMQGGAAHQLHIEVALPDRAAGGLAGHRERLGQQVVEGLAVGDSLAELDGLCGELLVGQVVDLWLEGVRQLGEVFELLELPAFAQVGDLVEDRHVCSFVTEGMLVHRTRARG